MRGRGVRLHAVTAISLVAILGWTFVPRAAAYVNGDDLPGPPAHLETIPTGSLVIPMDHTYQALVAPFNLAAYGLVDDLLQNGIPVKWAIRAGKAKDGIDFTATAQRISPSVVAAASIGFAGGPFIVHRDFVPLALVRIAAFARNVAVYQLTADASIDIRYTLTHKPNIAVSDDNTDIHTDILDAAVITNYTILDPTTLLPNACFTSHSEPHTTVVGGVAPVKAFVQSGGNFLAQCKASQTFETNGLMQTTNNYVIANTNMVYDYPSADLAFSQFTGALDPNPGGSEQDWRLAVGSVFQNNNHVHANNTGASPATYAATASKLYYGGPGGMVFYLGGHEYKDNTLASYNGRRMYLDFIFVPTTRPASCNLDFAASLRTMSGTVYEDVNGDGGLGDAVGRPNATVRLYADVNDNGLVDVGDTYLAQAPTDASGNYSFSVSGDASGYRYLIAVDSKSVTPSGGLNGGFTQGDVWPEQTRGDDPSTPALDVAPRFGGRNATTSDNVVASTLPASNTYEHVARVDVTAASVAGIHFAFSFNVMTNLRAGDAADDDGAANRTVQGSMRQFLQNAAAVAGANVMRFVPAVATNASGGGGTWWSLSVTATLTQITDAATTIDGQAYSSIDGTTARNDNPGTLGVGGTVGIDGLALSTAQRPELQIVDGGGLALGLDVQAATGTIRSLCIYGFGVNPNSGNDADIRVGATASGALIEQNVIGTTAASFADPGAGLRSGGDHVHSIGGDNGTVRNNVIGYGQGKGVELNSGSNGWLVESNEIRRNAIGNASSDAVAIENTSGSATVRGNLVVQTDGVGVDVFNSSGTNTIVNNTVQGNGIGSGGTLESAGIRINDSGTTVDRNIVNANFGAGVMVGSTASGARITNNSIYANGTINTPSGQIGIDLLKASDDPANGTAPFVTLNDSGDPDAGGNGLFNYPILTTAALVGTTLHVGGYARPGSTIEIFVSDPDPSGFGEGRTFLFSAVEGGGSDNDSTTGTYGPGAINGLAQGTDTTNRFSFSFVPPVAVSAGDILTATATDGSGSTSEFSGGATVIHLALTKRAFSVGGAPISDASVLPKGTPVTFLLYLNNFGGAINDVTLRDVLDPVFAWDPLESTCRHASLSIL